MLGAQTNQWVKIPWKAEVTSTSDQSVVPFHIDNAIYESKYEGFPLYQSSISNVASNVEITLGAVKYKLADKQIAGFENVIPNTLKFEAKLVISHGKEQWQIFVLPFLQINGQLNLVESLELVVRPIPDIPIASRSRAFKDKSQFASGTYYKLSIPKYGVYKIDYNYFKNTLKINPEQIDPRNIKLWGTGGGRLPERSSDPRVDDVDQIAIKVVGEEDGKFNEGDYVLFYGTGPDRVKFVDGPKPYFLQTKNIYDDESNYFLQVADDKGLRITQKTAESQFEMVSTGFDDFIAYEEDQVNLLGSYVSSQGGGKEWYGDYFDLNKTFDYTSKFKFDHIRTEDSARVDFKFVARFDSDFASVAPVNLKVENSNFSTQLKGTNLSNNEATYAFANTISQRFKASNDNLSVVVNFPSVPGSAEQKGWLDYIQINARRNLILDKAWQTFRDLQAISKSSTQFNFQTDGKFYEIWDVSAPLVPQLQPVNTSSNALTFNTLTGGLREFLAFQTTGEFTAPSYIGTIDNQNLHQITKADMIVLYHPDFKEAAERITLYRQQHNGFEVHAVSVLDIYNEFSGGTVDPVAIRDFFRMVYSRDPNLSYALLLGDGTYDYRNISKNLAYENFIPVYETDESRDPINTFPTDDFFTQLDPNEGGSLVSDGLDIAIGRMPARTAKEALGMVDKIIHYESSPFCHGSWRLDQSLVADDNTVGYYEDFFDQTEDIANPLALKFPFLNVNRIQFDAYKEEYTPGGERHPAVKSTINAEMYKGLLVINYLGHGGPNGWAQERVLELSDIQSWDNYDHLPLMITATCSFAGYDDPSVNSAGELAIRRPDGGVAALFTTVRAVYAFQNFTLTDNVFKNLFVLENGHYISVGETLRRAKKLSTNDRKFMLLGDPAMKLAVPEWKVDITEINGKAVDQNFADTARALSIVTVKGKISDGLGNARPDFNGTLYPTVFD
ncbi:MAG: type IX secretion system sortase PorU, partial [Saprospiraceae bacterium]